MPVEPVFVDATIVAVGERLPATGNLAIVGQGTGGSGTDNTVYEITSRAAAETQFGVGSDIAAAVDMAIKQKVRKVFCVRATRTNVAAESVTRGSQQTLAMIAGNVNNRSVSGKVSVVIAGHTVSYSYATTLSDPGAGLATVNTRTGGIYINGTGVIGTDYTWVNWQTALDALNNYTKFKMNVIILANTVAKTQTHGDLNAVFYYATVTNTRWINAIQADPTATAAQAVTDIVTAVPSGGGYAHRNVVGVAHKDTTTGDDIAASVAGSISVIDAWDKLMWKTILGLAWTSPVYHTKVEIETTLEGGKVNALMTKLDLTLVSDGLTTSTDATYKYIDITRTQYYLVDQVTLALDNLIKNSRVPYTPGGIEAVRAAIANALEVGVINGALRSPFKNTSGVLQHGYTIDMPRYEDIPPADRTARQLKNVYITAWLAGHIQSITVNMTIQL